MRRGTLLVWLLFYAPRRAVRVKSGPCAGLGACEDRRRAVAEGRMFWHFIYHGWVMPDDPLRKSSGWQAIWFAGRDTTGEPYLHRDCPWCGREMPAPSTSDSAALPYGDDGN